MITDNQYIKSSLDHNVEVAAIKAVAEVESSGHGIINGKPVILFEPHIFHKELLKIGITPKTYISQGYGDILYPKWGEKPYPKTQAERWAQMDRAVKINREAALRSASYGRFQIMGFNAAACGCKTVQDFVNAMFESEDKHLELFMNFITNTGLLSYLRNHAWAAFAKGYNGASFAKNNYHIKLQNAYDKYK